MSTTPPVTLNEVRDFLNFDASDLSHDTEVWAMATAATEAVEARCGLMTPQTITETVCAERNYLEPTRLPFISLTSIAKAGVTIDANTLYIDSVTGFIYSRYGMLYGAYDLVYQAGRSEVPESLKQCVLILTGQLFQSQRGPSSTAKFSGNAASATDDSTWRYKGNLWTRTAEALAAPYTDQGNA